MVLYSEGKGSNVMCMLNLKLSIGVSRVAVFILTLQYPQALPGSPSLADTTFTVGFTKSNYKCRTVEDTFLAIPDPKRSGRSRGKDGAHGN